MPKPSIAVRKLVRNLVALARGDDLLTHVDTAERNRLRAEARAELVIRELLNRHYGGVALPPPELREHVGTDSAALGYWSKGINSSRRVLEVFGANPGAPILDWGCGSGRTLTWLRDSPAWRANYAGCDVDEAAIEWLRGVGETGVSLCSTNPPLPYGDEHFGGVFAFSVLTHIPAELHRTWYAELHRVTKPGAKLLITTMGAPMARTIGKGLADALARDGFAWLDVEGHYRDAAIVSEAFTRSAVKGLFVRSEFREAGYGDQDMWVFER